MKSKKAYGSWDSTISSQSIVAKNIGLFEVTADASSIYWLESRPQEAGRVTVMEQKQNGSPLEWTQAPFNARTRVHEYGGGAYHVTSETKPTLYFTNFADQRIYKVEQPGGKPVAITSDEDIRFADYRYDAHSHSLIGIREDHRTNQNQPKNEIVRIDLNSNQPTEGEVLVTGADFYASPRVSPDGKQLCWIEWDHPNMPWDDSFLKVAPLSAIDQVSIVAGGKNVSAVQPEWDSKNGLIYLSDDTGWWNFYRRIEEKSRPLCRKKSEFGFPQWVFGLSRYCLLNDKELFCAYTEDGKSKTAILNIQNGKLNPIATEGGSLDFICKSANGIAAIWSSSIAASRVVEVKLQNGIFRTLRESSQEKYAPDVLSKPEKISFKTAGDKTAYAYFYKPSNPDFEGLDGELPPLIIQTHGGPTSAASGALSMKIQYWTSRGFAVADVDYGGSTGYGREYRERLKGQWGIVDVQDCEAVARHLANQKLIDPKRVTIKGGSAGGYTTLRALTSSKVFCAGASYYGVSDLGALAEDTHKFESRYLDGLIGPYPETKALYKERSPMSHIDNLRCPVIFFQGDEDKVVPPNQAEMMVEALKEKGIPVAYVLFKGEQHGFRKSENIKSALENEWYFYSKIFDFELPEKVTPVEIFNI